MTLIEDLNQMAEDNATLENIFDTLKMRNSDEKHQKLNENVKKICVSYKIMKTKIVPGL